MTREEARKIIKESVNKYGVAHLSDDFIEGWNAGIGFLVAGLKEYADPIEDILKEPPILSR